MLHNLRHGPLPRKPYLKSTRLGKRKRVTLIAAFRCLEGVVICADSQETSGYRRGHVNKMARFDGERYQAVIAGAGEWGVLVDGLAENLIEEIESWPEDYGKRNIKRKITATLKDYYVDVVDHFPFPPDPDHPHEPPNKFMSFVLCLRRQSNGDVLLWRLDGTAINSAEPNIFLLK